jgi:hypothetical protein
MGNHVEGDDCALEGVLCLLVKNLGVLCGS